MKNGIGRNGKSPFRALTPYMISPLELSLPSRNGKSPFRALTHKLHDISFFHHKVEMEKARLGR